MDVLLSRCVQENDPEARVLLATCLGEVGAISANRLDDAATICGSTQRSSAAAMPPPWRLTPPLFGLSLVTRPLVGAHKAALTSIDQHKIAFTIQQLLGLLNEDAKAGKLPSPKGKSKSSGKKHSLEANSDRPGNSSKESMEPALQQQLKACRVLEYVEPYWHTEFHEVRDG